MDSRSATRLALVTHLLELAAARLEALTEGVDHPRVRDAGNYLRAGRGRVVDAVGGVGATGRFLLSLVLMGASLWLVATLLGDVLGLPGGWTIGLSLAIVLLGLAFPVVRVLDAIDRLVGRRLTARPASAPAVTPPAGVGTAAETLTLLRLARRELTAAMRDRAAGHRGADNFDRLCRRDKRLRLLSRADRDLCITIHALEIWLPRAQEQ